MTSDTTVDEPTFSNSFDVKNKSYNTLGRPVNDPATILGVNESNDYKTNYDKFVLPNKNIKTQKKIAGVSHYIEPPYQGRKRLKENAEIKNLKAKKHKSAIYSNSKQSPFGGRGSPDSKLHNQPSTEVIRSHLPKGIGSSVGHRKRNIQAEIIPRTENNPHNSSHLQELEHQRSFHT